MREAPKFVQYFKKKLKKNPEMEERVLTDEIYPLRKYLIDIEYAGDNPDVRNIIDNYLSKWTYKRT